MIDLSGLLDFIFDNIFWVIAAVFGLWSIFGKKKKANAEDQPTKTQPVNYEDVYDDLDDDDDDEIFAPPTPKNVDDDMPEPLKRFLAKLEQAGEKTATPAPPPTPPAPARKSPWEAPAGPVQPQVVVKAVPEARPTVAPPLALDRQREMAPVTRSLTANKLVEGVILAELLGPPKAKRRR